MARYRCSRCKEDVGEYGIRHKYASGLFCEPCLRELRVHGYGKGGFWRFFKGLVEWATKPLRDIFKPKPAAVERTLRVAHSVMKSKALGIAPDANKMNPQKR